MIPVTFDRIAAVTGGSLLPGTPGDATVVAVPQIDSRLVGPGSLFCCLHGERTDGHSYAGSAVAAGAVGVLAGRAVDAPGVLVTDVPAALAALAREVLETVRAGGGITVIGITGSSGKTSTKDLLAQVLEPSAATVAPAGSFNNELGLPLTVCAVTGSTRWLVLEYSARGVGHIAQLCRTAQPDIAMVLNVGRAHVGEFGDLDTTTRAKAELVEALGSSGVAVLNADDPRVASMATRTPARVVRVGTAAADVRVGDLRADPDGCPSFRLDTPAGSRTVSLRLSGAHQAGNAAAVAATALTVGIDLDTIVARLENARLRSPHRMALARRGDGLVVIDDAYNANPESMLAALRSLAVTDAARRIAVLGPMRELGRDSAALHEQIGRAAAELHIDRVVAVGDAAPAALGARAVASWHGTAEVVPDGDAAFARLSDLGPGDAVLVKASNSARLWIVAERLLEPAAATGVGER